MVKPDLLTCFIAAADTGSFSAAGRLLGKHLSTVSGNIARLEDELGVLLFDREGKYPQLTEAGLNLYDGAKVVVDSVERFTRNANQLSAGVPATFTLAIDEDLNFQPIAPLLKQAQQQWPHLRFKVLCQSVKDIFDGVRENQIDLALTPILEGNSQFYEFQAIGQCDVMIICSKHHELAKKRQVSNDDLMAHTQILSSSLQKQDTLYKVTKMSPYVCFVNGYQNMLQLVQAGVGWAMAYSPQRALEQDIKILSPEFMQTNMQIQYDIIWPKNQSFNEVHQFFQERIKKLLSPV